MKRKECVANGGEAKYGEIIALGLVIKTTSKLTERTRL